MDNLETILWQGILMPGHDACRVYYEDSQWHLEGTAVFSHDLQPCLLSYQIICDVAWHTLSVKVDGWIEKKIVSTQIRTGSGHRWWLNDVEVLEVAGCIDVDLNFSPSTNLIPIRRLNLKVGEKAELTAAWLKFPSLKLEPIPQSYKRLEEQIYRYESGNGSFVADLRVNPAGFVLDYPDIWRAEHGL
jgi:hypothetical protein